MNNKINLTWFNSKNWGDALNPYLISLISNKNVHFVTREDILTSKYLCIGSILSYASENTMVWGTGFISKNDRLNFKPKEIFSVRGPLTRKKVLEQGYSCPDSYGDPALLLPLFYNPSIPKKYKYGIIPHYVDKDNIYLSKIKRDDTLIIDVLSDTETFIKNIKSCEFIFSSSLHGVISCDSYGIPCSWIKFSDKIVGGDFKFNDYFLSIGQNIKTPFSIEDDIDLDYISKNHEFYDLKIDVKKILDSCPFSSYKHQISNATSYDRYPNIFNIISNIQSNNLKILSYGCSNGEEVSTLNDIYFNNCEIYGYDIDSTVLKKASSRLYSYDNKNTINIVDKLDNIKFDVIFAMSILCKWPMTKNVDNCSMYYSFETFESEVIKIDNLLKIGGYLIIYNSNYIIEDTVVSNKYKKSEFILDSGFVTKYNKDGSIYEGKYNYCIFQKVG